MGVVRPGQYAIFLLDVRSGEHVGPDGEPQARDAATCLIFDDKPSALAYAREKIERMPTVVCEIYDSAGKANPPLARFVNARCERASDASAFAGKARMGIGAALLAGSVPLFLWDWRSHGRLMLPTLIGINMIFAGLRLLQWGYGTLEAARRARDWS